MSYRWFPKLKEIDLANFWDLGASGVLSFCNFEFLSKLKLGPCLIDSPSLSHLSQLKNLKYLKLKKCTKIDFLPSITSLEILKVKNSSFLVLNSEKNFNKKIFPLLKNLTIENCPLEDHQLEFISGEYNETLEKLSISYCQKITNIGLQRLENFQTLKSFKCRGTENITDFSLEWPPSITKFDMRNSKKIGDKILTSLKNNDLEYLDLQSTLVSDKIFLELLSNGLKVLRIKNCEYLSSPSFEILSSKCKNLEELTVSFISPSHFLKLNCENLRTLKLFDCNFSFTDFQIIIPKMKDLNILKLFRSPINENIVELISKNLSLTKLAINDDSLNDEALSFIPNLYPKLKEINFSDCSNLTDEGFKFYFKYFIFFVLYFFILYFFFHLLFLILFYFYFISFLFNKKRFCFNVPKRTQTINLEVSKKC